MNKLAVAESALVSKLELARSVTQATHSPQSPASSPSPSPTHHKKKTTNPRVVSSSLSAAATEESDDIREVLNLEVPRYDKNRKFPSIEKQKITKKDRHVTALDDFSKQLEALAEQIENQVLSISRTVRDNLESLDREIKSQCAVWKIDQRLILMSSPGLDEARSHLQSTISRRLAAIESFAKELEDLECQRAEDVGKKIKVLVDTLIGIAHQLPDEIEHIVEAEAYDLNTVLTKNRKAHIELLGVMRTKQVEIEVIALHEWDVAKAHWRHLRHQQAISVFHQDITSSSFTEPTDRQEFMRNVRIGQQSRQGVREDALAELGKLNSENLTTPLIQAQQQILQQVNEEELAATQDCYNGLSELRSSLQRRAERRMEELRVELHEYGALCEEPPLADISKELKSALSSPELTELWRVGGGLKPDIFSTANDFTSTNIFYDSFLRTAQDRLEILVCSFNLKEVLNERGRLPRLDTVRNLLSKTRTVPRLEVANVLGNLLPDLKEMAALEKMPGTFQQSLLQCIDAMEQELLRLSQETECDGTLSAVTSAAPLSLGTLPQKESTKNMKKTAGATTLGDVASSSTLKTGRISTSRTMKTAALESEKAVLAASVDPNLVKQWTRVLGILYYGCDLPQNYQQQLLRALESTKQQRLCNDHVDMAVKDACERELDRLDLRYKRLSDSIITFLELQTSSLTYSCTQIIDFYLKTAKVMETHKAKQLKLDETSLDALWDEKEENRLACEEREKSYQEACKRLQRSPDMAELQENFQEVLRQLDVILENYRTYHGKACFLADQYPVSLADDFSSHMLMLCSLFDMEPMTPHRILEEQERLHDLNKRFNKKYLPETEKETDPTGAEASNADALLSAAQNETAKQYAEIFYLEEILPPRQDSGDVDDLDEDSEEPDPAPHRKYGLLVSFQDFVQRFLEDSSSSSLEDGEEDGAGLPLLPSKGDEDLGVNPSGGITEKANPTFPWLVMKIFPGQEEPPMVTLLDEETLQGMEPDEVEAYEEGIEKYFVRPADDVLQQLFQPSEQEETQPSLKEAYEKTLSIVERVQQRKEEKSSKYLRENPPKDSKDSPFVCVLDIASNSLSAMLQDLKISLFTHLERTSSVRIEEAEVLTKKRKHELTEELEDLLRTHWPRSGLVETQIKRPREVELLNHEEKTYRFIVSIQEKVAALQQRFEDELKMAEECCEDYKIEIQRLTEQLSNVQFKTLASLQGVEVKARSTTQSFTATGNNFLTKFRQLVAEDASSILIYAKDFRKICPPQEEGKDSGGYSPAELDEIGRLVEGQCQEIEELLSEWREAIQNMEQRFQATVTDHGIFTNKFDEVANALALSQGLGQKYGAPRRRAQERLRTEMSRDEQCAGKVDELIALLEFSCSEAVRKCEATKCSPSVISSLLQGKELTSSSSKGGRDLGFDELQAVDGMWELSLKVRRALYERAVYLSVIANPEEEGVPPIDIPWPTVTTHLPSASLPPSSAEDSTSGMMPATSSQKLQEIVDEVEKVCIQETQELYSKEGKGDLLKETSEGIPESLSLWLRETRQKILGPKGHHEKSWKRLWNQIDSFEMLFGRKTGPMDQPQTKVAVPAACFRILGYGYEQFLSQSLDGKVEQFLKILKLFEKGKEKHERQLRPRLGSPDALPELLQLDAIEGERSNDLRQNVEQFQSQQLSLLSSATKILCEDLGSCATAFIRYLDTSLRLDLIRVPPDTEVPKKKMTLKRLRKAQRIQEAVKNGGEDSSAERMWPSLPLESVLQGLLPSFLPSLLAPTIPSTELSKAEPLILLADLQAIAPPAPPPSVETQQAATPKAPAAKGKKKAETVAPVVPAVPQSSRPELVPESWVQMVREKSSVRGEVSTAHRLLVNERDHSLERFSAHLTRLLDENKIYYGKILQQEESWNQRWRTQVEMLKQGNL